MLNHVERSDVLLAVVIVRATSTSSVWLNFG
jgi:hypothetical protein